MTSVAAFHCVCIWCNVCALIVLCMPLPFAYLTAVTAFCCLGTGCSAWIFSVINMALIAICTHCSTHCSVHTVLKTSSVCRLVRAWWTWQRWWEKTREWCQQLSCGPTPISRRSSGGTPVSLPIFWPSGALSTALALAGMHACFLVVLDAGTVVIELWSYLM